MKLHHIGIVCSESDINKFFFRPKKKFVYNDRVQKNMAKHALIGLTSSASNDVYEEQISLALGIRNI